MKSFKIVIMNAVVALITAVILKKDPVIFLIALNTISILREFDKKE